VFSLTPLVVLLAVVEGALRLAGFEHRSSLEAMQFTFSVEGFNAEARVPILQRDDVVFWRPRPNVRGHNSHGTFGPEFSQAKPEGTRRFVCLGDSCTHYGPVAYPQRWQKLLNAESQQPCEVINAGVIGYSSLQGLRRLETDVGRWSPDVITVYFGWNDHWLARGFRDSEQRPPRTAVAGAAELLDHLRSYQLASLAAARLRAAQTSGVHRVELAEYAENLRAMVRAGRALKSQVWLITAAHALEQGIPAYLTATREVADPAGLLALHQAYNEAVRQVASELDAPLVDLAGQIDALADKARFFDDDHIHLSDAGKDLLAEQLLAMAVSRGLVERRVSGGLGGEPLHSLQRAPAAGRGPKMRLGADPSPAILRKSGQGSYVLRAWRSDDR
jgi:lysophospholipase L1-like esterase